MIQAFKMLDQIQETDLNNVKSDEGCKFSFIINKNARAKIWWDLFTNIFYVMAYFITPYNIAFDLPNKNHENYTHHVLELVLDTVFLCDMLVTFVTDINSDPGVPVKN